MRQEDENPIRLQPHRASGGAGADVSNTILAIGFACAPFPGLGTQPPRASWRPMIQASRDDLGRAPRTALAPGMAVAITVLGLNLVGGVPRDMLDPRARP